MKFQDSSFNDLKVTVGTKSVTHPRTHPPTHAGSKSNMPHQLFQSWGHNHNKYKHYTYLYMYIYFHINGEDIKINNNFITIIFLLFLA